MKLLLLSQYFWPETFGINALAKALVRNGTPSQPLPGSRIIEGKVFPGYSAWQAMSERYDGVDILRLPLVPRGKRSALRLAMNYVSFILSALMMGPLMLRRRDFDAIFVYALRHCSRRCRRSSSPGTGRFHWSCGSRICGRKAWPQPGLSETEPSCAGLLVLSDFSIGILISFWCHRPRSSSR